MKHSIRKFLLVNLLLAIALTTSLTVVGNYYLDRKDIQEHLDTLVFNALDKPSGSQLILSRRDEIRNELAQRITRDDVYIMLLTFPLSGLLIWIIIGRGLLSIDRVTKEVASRVPTHLDPVSLDAIPEEIKPMIDELNKLFFRLQEGFEREKRFASDAAHELKTPLAAIKTQAQVALNTHDLEEKNTAMTKLITSVNRSTHIVQQLLTMSRLVPDTPNLTGFEPVDLIRVTREILAMMTPVALKKHAELEFEADQTTPSFQGNVTAICILIRNLIDNAIRYTNTGEQGLILVRVQPAPDHQHVILEVTDNGPGIPEALSTRVFERFFRVLGNKTSGSGLGLAIVKQICELHHARIELSTPEQHRGLIVRVYFPCGSPHGNALSNSQ
ncbi:MAG: GHKL domain-containing protein, partial [Legionella sp.]|nr:GHKL domain-containing protein [Legionella sp.]